MLLARVFFSADVGLLARYQPELFPLKCPHQ